MNIKLTFFSIAIAALLPLSVHAAELVIGEEKVQPGVVFIFEGAVKDHVTPEKRNLPEKQTDVHIEARVNWNETDIPEGAPPGGFVPYLHVSAKVVNEKTGLSTFIDLTPHINLIDNFHYARNISLPGKASDLYTVTFFILKPTHIDISLHRDWLNKYGDKLTADHTFTYKKVNFKEIVEASR